MVMELSIRDAKARLSEAIVAMERGERVVFTRFGREVAQLRKPEPPKPRIDWEAGARFLEQRGLDDIQVSLPDYFDDPAYSRRVLGLDE